MWCARCQADVAAEASATNQRLYCTACGSALTIPLTPELTPAESTRKKQNPHELLARWAGNKLLDPFGPLWEPDAAESFRNDPPPSEKELHSATAPSRRMDGAHRTRTVPNRRDVTANPANGSSRINREQRSAIDLAVQTDGTRPRSSTRHQTYAGVSNALGDTTSNNWVTFAGQMFAYLGVGALTLGTVTVLVGYFGGPAHYAPTGWLITTVGQMLLFLGVVTLISGGLEQTTQLVTSRMDLLTEKFARIERILEATFPENDGSESQQTPDSNRQVAPKTFDKSPAD